jgi:hypothetical protein
MGTCHAKTYDFQRNRERNTRSFREKGREKRLKLQAVVVVKTHAISVEKQWQT